MLNIAHFDFETFLSHSFEIGDYCSIQFSRVVSNLFPDGVFQNIDVFKLISYYPVFKVSL